MILNPWKRIRALEAELADAERDIAMLGDQLYNAERIAFLRAQEYFEERTRHIQMYNEHLTQKLMEIAAGYPAAPIIVSRKDR